MPEYRITVNVEKDGVSLADFPYIIRTIFNEDQSGTVVLVPDNNSSSFHPVQAMYMPALGMAIFRNDQAMNLQVNANTPVPMNANGLVLFFNCDMTQATPNQNFEVNNPALTGGVSINLRTQFAGT